jgi:polysaccharide export outer membrane protein
MHRWFITLSFVAMAGTLGADQQVRGAGSPSAKPGRPTLAAAIEPPPGFVIGPADVLSIVFWRDKDMSTEVTVGPDGKISLPLLNEVQAAGLTPVDLRARLAAESKRFFENPNVTVVVKQINSRRAFITGQVVKPGPYSLIAPTTVLQLISMAGGLKDFADSKHIMIVREENGRRSGYLFNYKELGRKLSQYIELKPGDTVVVP